MSDNRRRVFARIFFILFCALPTIGVLYKICHPQTAESWARTIQAELGLTTTVDSVETPGPFHTILRGLEFSDPDEGTLLKAVEARLYFGDVNTIEVPFRIHGMTNHGLERLLTKLNKNLIRADAAEKRWRIVFSKELSIEEHQAAKLYATEKLVAPPRVILTDLQIDVVPLVDGTLAELHFKVAGSEENNEFVACKLSRTDEHGHWLELDTKGNQLPCWLVNNSVPQVRDLGEHAMFKGVVEVSPTLGREKMFVDGTLDKVDLQRSVDPSVFTNGPGERYARIELDDCMFESGTAVKLDALLFQEPYATPVQIREEKLFAFRREVSLGQAISAALENRNNGVRIGALPTDSRSH